MRYLLFFLLLTVGAQALPGKPIPHQDFNTKVAAARERGEAWVKSPLQVALKLVGDNQECRQRNIEIKSTPEAFRDAHVVITEDGFLDDSVRGVRYELKLRRSPRGEWQVQAAAKTWRCWEGRGHQDYSTEPCQ